MLATCAVHVHRSKAIESTAPRVELNLIRLRTLSAVSGYLIVILADNLYFLKTWFNFELPEISCSSIKALWVLWIWYSRFAWHTSSHHTQGGIIIKHKETQLRTRLFAIVGHLSKKEKLYTRTCFTIIFDDRWVMMVGDGIAGMTNLFISLLW